MSVGETVDFICVDPNNVKHFKSSDQDLEVEMVHLVCLVVLSLVINKQEMCSKITYEVCLCRPEQCTMSSTSNLY